MHVYILQMCVDRHTWYVRHHVVQIIWLPRHWDIHVNHYQGVKSWGIQGFEVYLGLLEQLPISRIKFE